MYHIQAQILVRAPLEQVFTAISDHESFLSGPDSECHIARTGSPHRNGTAAIREVNTASLNFSEEIVAFDPPHRFDYVVTNIQSKSGRTWPIRHERGWLTCEPDPAGTRVQWHSRFAIPIPILGWIAERVIGPMMASTFQKLLTRAKTQLEQEPAALNIPAEAISTPSK